MSRCARALKPARQERGRPDDRHGGSYRRGKREEHVRAGDQIDAGGHHGRGVDERAHRRRTGHGVGQPGLQRQLGGFSHRAA